MDFGNTNFIHDFHELKTGHSTFFLANTGIHNQGLLKRRRKNPFLEKLFHEQGLKSRQEVFN